MAQEENRFREPEYFVYTVKERDLLSDILRRFEISVREFADCNRACDVFSLEKGQTVRIRRKKCGAKNTYVLKENESLWSVAEKFEKSAISLLKANPHLLPQEVRPGVKIKLPD